MNAGSGFRDDARLHRRTPVGRGVPEHLKIASCGSRRSCVTRAVAADARGLQQLRTQGYFQKLLTAAGSFRIWVPALVAAAGAGLALFLWLSRVTGPSPILFASLDSRTAARATSSVAAHFTFVSVRGGSAPTSICLPQG